MYRESTASERSRSKECFYCLGSGYQFIGHADESDQEQVTAYPCLRCNPPPPPRGGNALGFLMLYSAVVLALLTAGLVWLGG